MLAMWTWVQAPDRRKLSIVACVCSSRAGAVIVGGVLRCTV